MLKKIRQKIVKHHSTDDVRNSKHHQQLSPARNSEELSDDKCVNGENVAIFSPSSKVKSSATSPDHNGQELDVEVGFDPALHGKFGGVKTDCDKLAADLAQLAKDVNYVDFDEPQRSYAMTTSDSFTTFKSPSPQKQPQQQQQSNSPLAKKSEEHESGYSTLDDIQGQLSTNANGDIVSNSSAGKSQCTSYDNFLYQVAVREARAQARAAMNLTYGDPGMCLASRDATLCDPGYASLSECMEKAARHLSAGSGDSQMDMDCSDHSDKSVEAMSISSTSSDTNNKKSTTAAGGGDTGTLLYAKAVVDKKAGCTQKKGEKDLYPPLPERRYSAMEASDSGVSDGHEDDLDLAAASKETGNGSRGDEDLSTLSPLQIQIPEEGVSSHCCSPRSPASRCHDDKGLTSGIATSPSLTSRCSSREDICTVLQKRAQEVMSADEGIVVTSSVKAAATNGMYGMNATQQRGKPDGKRRAGSSCSSSGGDGGQLVNTLASPELEPTHMTWDEVIHEAKVLGIPLNKPLPQALVVADGSKVKDFSSPAKLPEKKRSNLRDKFASFFGKKHHNHVSADDVTDAGQQCQVQGHHTKRRTSRRGHSDIELTSDEEWNMTSARSVCHQSAFSILPQQYRTSMHHRREKSQVSIGERLASPASSCQPLPRNAVTPPPRYMSQSCDRHLPCAVDPHGLPFACPTALMTSSSSSSKKVQRAHSCSFMRSVSAHLRRTPSGNSKSSLTSANTPGYNAAGTPSSYISSPQSMGPAYMAGGSVGGASFPYTRQASCESTLNGYRSAGEGYRSAGETVARRGYHGNHHGHHRDRVQSDTARVACARVPATATSGSSRDRPVSDGLTRSKMAADGTIKSCLRRTTTSATTTPSNDVTSPLGPGCSLGSMVYGSGDVMTCSVSSQAAMAAAANALASLAKLKDVGWYWGPLSWEEAESKLDNKPDGAFLVRDSSDDHYILSLTFRSHGTTHHTRIEHYKGTFSFYSQPKSHGASTITEFIEKAMEHSRSGRYLYFLRPRAPGLPPAPIQLLFPVSRFRQVASLQHLCRFLILKQVRRDHISQLPVPSRIIEYLEQTQYYTEFPAEATLEEI